MRQRRQRQDDGLADVLAGGALANVGRTCAVAINTGAGNEEEDDAGIPGDEEPGGQTV